VLNLPEQVAAQYCSIDENEINATLYVLYNFKLKPNSFKYLLKNKGFQTGSTDLKTLAALKTFDLDFVRRYIEEVKPDLQRALLDAVQIGFSDGVKLFLSDPRVDPGARDNEPLFYAAAYGHVQVIKILLSDCRVDSSTLSNQILINAAQEGHAEAVKTLLSHPRVELLAETIKDALYFAKKEGHAEAVKVLQSYVKD
jgi:ankyrin repeat protein